MTEQNHMSPQPERSTPPSKGAVALKVWRTRLLNLGVVVALVLLGVRFQQDFNAERVLQENDRLHRSLEEAITNLDELRQSVDSLHAIDKEIRQLAKLDPIPDEVRKMGVGGAIYESTLPGISSQTLGELAQLERETRLLHESLSRAKEMVVMQADRMRRLPSIVPVEGVGITSRFGFREDPFSGSWRMHEGIDFGANVGTAVLAPADGTVIETGFDSGYGLTIKIDHGDGVQTLYAHLSRTQVVEGEDVRRGDRIGSVGSTGRSTSPHLHYEVHVRGRIVDPEPYVMQELADLAN